MRPLLAFVILLFAVVAHPDVPRFSATKLSRPPEIAKLLDDPVWKEAAKQTSFQDPFTGKEYKDQTDVWLGYDEVAIYVGFHAHTSTPDRLIGREIQPGAEFKGEDSFTFMINPFGTRAYEGRSKFTTNLLGTQAEDIAGGRAGKREWRGEWTAKVATVADGWVGVYVIPWKVLNYPTGSALNMDINFSRFHGADQVRTQWANTTVADRPELVGLWTGVTPPKIDKRKRLQLLVYAAAEYEGGKPSIRTGLDARFQMTSTFSGLLSVSPDFKNVENQVAGNSFTRTERYIDDVRPFFTEGGGFFKLTEGFTFGQMFYSQRITQFDTGAKFFGRLSPSTGFGALVTTKFNGDSNAVARIEKIFTPQSNASAYMTVSKPKGGPTNQAFGGTAFLRRGTFNFSGDFASEQTQGSKANTAGAYSIAYEAPKWFSIIRQMWISPNFNPALGYIPWTDRKGFFSYTKYENEVRTGPLLRYSYDFYTTDYKTYANKLQQKGAEFSASAVLRSDIRLSISRKSFQFENGTDRTTSFRVTFNNSNRLKRFGLGYDTGIQADKPSSFITGSASYRVFGRFDVGAQVSILQLQGNDSLAIFTVGNEFSPTRSLTGRIVMRNGQTNAYLAFRNGGWSGSEFYVILGDPNSPRTVTRLSFKFVWPF